MPGSLRQERERRAQRNARRHHGANNEHRNQQYRRTNRAKRLAEGMSNDNAEIAPGPLKIMI
jgi:hypothetical protein